MFLAVSYFELAIHMIRFLVRDLKFNDFGVTGAQAIHVSLKPVFCSILLRLGHHCCSSLIQPTLELLVSSDFTFAVVLKKNKYTKPSISTAPSRHDHTLGSRVDARLFAPTSVYQELLSKDLYYQSTNAQPILTFGAKD